MADETVGEWRLRKTEQANRLIQRMPHLKIDFWQDYRTRFVAVDEDQRVAVIFGQLPWRDGYYLYQPGVDLTDDEVISLFSKAPT